MSNPLTTQAAATVVAGTLAAAWAFLPTVRWMVEKWLADPQYSHGFLVPAFSGYLLWTAHKAGGLRVGRPSPAVAAGLFAGVLAVRWLAGGLMFHQLDCLALMLTVAALCVAAGGWTLLRGCGPAVLFLVFMVPLPFEVERNVGGPLKQVATAGSTFLLQTVGQPAIAEGHKILIDEVELGVVDACSGLKMLLTFSAFAAGAVLTLGRTKFENLMVLLGIVPIAVVTNVLRITATGVAYTHTADKATQHFLHDLHGWLMMPVGLALLGAQLWCLSRLVVPPPPAASSFAPLRPSYA
jgi:exosortase